MSESKATENIVRACIELICFRSIGLDEPLLSSYVLDSMARVELIVALETAFGMKIQLSEMGEANFETTRKICSFIETKNGAIEE